jgi:hypothetical protein
MANTKFTRAVKKAKGLYKTGRYSSFAAAVKAAYKKVGGKTKTSRKPKKKAVRKRTTAKRVSSPAMSGTSLGRATVATLKSAIRNRLKDGLGKKLVRREMATTKRDRRRIGKEILKVKAELRKLM